ncbi:nucleotidyltransferase [Ascochyta rabiei]|uniref:polynucleotide adenylyltransferase n=1 Tax=Didymella rabiei TaxID=5454 RepID=A0A162WDF4_DIDRA|nr:nucleotidyltransferase [Ascochyta rabiei]
MSDRRHSTAATHLYAPYPLATAISPAHRQIQGRAPRLAVHPPSTTIPLQGWHTPLYSLSPLNPLHSLSHHHHHHHHYQPHKLPSSLPLHPFVHLARIDQVHPHPHAYASTALTATPAPAFLPSPSPSPLPSPSPSTAAAVIVSPHYSPPPEREEPRSSKHKPVDKTALTRQQLDGHKEQASSVHTRAPNMTSNDLRNSSSVASKQDDANITPQRLQRPSIVSQHSNSVPSTPLQLARKYESRSRSPSPNSGLGSHSPRSVSSEANSTMPTLRLGRPFKCKYETNVGSLGRRRMPYESSDILDKAKEEPKKTLDPHEDDKLSGDMRELYDRLQPSLENTRKRDRFVQKVQHMLEKEFPGNLSKVHVFGSSGNMLYTTDSDVDICIQTPMTSLEEMHPLAEALDKYGMERVVCIPQAKVRIVKVWDPELELACDMNVNNVAALENTRMIRTYIQIDERVRPLAMIIKHWTKQRLLNDAGIGGTISSYTWICLIINFLQTRDPPILPALHSLPFREIDRSTGQPSHSGFADDVDKLRGFGDSNKESVGQLLFHFFRLYGHEVDYEKEAISIRQGKRIPREEKGWHPGGGQKEGTNRLCVEEPFNIERNLGNSADDYAWHGLHLEIRRAFDLLADAQQLDKACEQFQFPVEGKPNPLLFQKPTSKKTTLTSSVPIRSGRGGSNHRGGRGGFNVKGQHTNGSRRSSGSQPFAQGRPPFLHSPPLQHGSGQEYFTVPRGIHDQLHDQLYQQYQMLEMQSNSLRAQLAAQQHAQQAHRAAQMHAHAVAQAQAQHYLPSSSNGSPQKSPYVNRTSSPRLAEIGIPPNTLPQGFLYQYPGFFNAQHSGAPQDSVRTNPSSPSLSNSMPGARRVVHRASNASDTSVNRSQSQPARGVLQQPVLASYPPMPQFYDPAAFAGYPVARSSQDTPETQSTSDSQSSPPSSSVEPAGSTLSSTPKEYMGYHVAEQPPVRSLQDYAVGAIPSFSELVQRKRRVSSEITQPLLNTALRRVSRSPSPLRGHVRKESTGVPPILPANEQRKARVDCVRPPPDFGPVIVNGSFSVPPRDQFKSERGDFVPKNENLGSSAIGPYASQPDPQQIKEQQIRELQARQQLVLEEMQRQSAANMMSSPVVNGSVQSSDPAEANGLARVPSEDRQPFPEVSDEIMNYDAKKDPQTHFEDVSPKQDVPPWRATALPNGLSSLDTVNAPRAPPQEIKTANLPLLSPVFEKRTPSPTANRQSENSKPTNGTKGHKEHHQQSRRASLPKQSTPSKDNGRGVHNKPNDKGQKVGSAMGNTGSWQSSQSRRKKNGRKRTPEQKTTGEPLPANGTERKGG